MTAPPLPTRKSLFLSLRYLYVVSAACLLLLQVPVTALQPVHFVMLAWAFGTNVALCFAREETLFAWYVEAPVLIADTLWVSWALHSTGAMGAEFFLLYFLVLSLASLGENLLTVLVGSTVASVANVYLVWDSATPGVLLVRIVFFYFVALFYGNVLSMIRHERQRADRGLSWVRELEEKVGERTAELQRLYEESAAASRAKSDFVANMSHELRTPLNIVIGYADMLLEPEQLSRERHDEVVVRIRDSAAGLLALVQSVLDLGKLETGREPVVKRPLAVDSFVDALSRRERVPLAAGVQLEWKVAPNLPVVDTDEVKLGMVLDNLVNNAIKFTTAGRIVVRVRDDAYRGALAFSVQDTGCGIDAAHLERIFEPFTQLEGAREARFGGVGLGLAIVQRHAKLLGAQIDVQSTVGAGTTFTVWLPYRQRRRAVLDAAA